MSNSLFLMVVENIALLSSPTISTNRYTGAIVVKDDTILYSSHTKEMYPGKQYDCAKVVCPNCNKVILLNSGEQTTIMNPGFDNGRVTWMHGIPNDNSFMRYMNSGVFSYKCTCNTEILEYEKLENTNVMNALEELIIGVIKNSINIEKATVYTYGKFDSVESIPELKMLSLLGISRIIGNVEVPKGLNVSYSVNTIKNDDV